MYPTLLVPLDGSSVAERAIPFAKSLSKALHARLLDAGRPDSRGLQTFQGVLMLVFAPFIGVALGPLTILALLPVTFLL
jgi:nucleotide-binding universal stress UspA family protein